MGRAEGAEGEGDVVMCGRGYVRKSVTQKAREKWRSTNPGEYLLGKS